MKNKILSMINTMYNTCKVFDKICDRHEILLPMTHKILNWTYDSLGSLVDILDETGDTRQPETGKVSYTITGKWVKGTTLRDMFAGSAALATDWLATSEDSADLDTQAMDDTLYGVNIDMHITFTPIEEDSEDPYIGIPYNGSELVRRLQQKQVKKGKKYMEH